MRRFSSAVPQLDPAPAPAILMETMGIHWRDTGSVISLNGVWTRRVGPDASGRAERTGSMSGAHAFPQADLTLPA